MTVKDQDLLAISTGAAIVEAMDKLASAQSDILVEVFGRKLAEFIGDKGLFEDFDIERYRETFYRAMGEAIDRSEMIGLIAQVKEVDENGG